MKYFILLSIITILSCSQSVDKKNLPAKIKELPIGLKVKHSVDTAYATLNEDMERGLRFKWNYETTVSTLKKELKIIEFGGYNKVGNSWVERNIDSRPFNNSEFEEWYNCEGGILNQGNSYTDHNNWSTAEKLNEGEGVSVWYFIGEDKKGKRYVGYDFIYTVSELR